MVRPLHDEDPLKLRSSVMNSVLLNTKLTETVVMKSNHACMKSVGIPLYNFDFYEHGTGLLNKPSENENFFGEMQLVSKKQENSLKKGTGGRTCCCW